MDDYQALDAQYIASTYKRFPVTFTHGDGCRLHDDAGKEYIDMGSGIAVSVLGYNDAEWTQTVAEQAAALSHVSNLYYTQPQILLARLLCERSGMKRAFFGNSGAEANECAIKAARKHAADLYGENVRPVVITLQNSFHGRTLATLAATGQDVFHHDFGPFPEGFRHVPPNDIGALREALDAGDVCAALFETIQGEGGVLPLDDEYLKAARELTREHGVLMMIDEVQTGNGRTGKLFGYQWADILPDVVTTAKGLAGGLPMGVCLLGEAVEHTLTPGSHGSTFGGNPICAAAALCVQRRLTDAFLAEVAKKGAYIMERLSAAPGVKCVTGRGLMLGILTDKNVGELARTLLDKGVVTLTAKDRLRLLPPLTIDWPSLKQAAEIIIESVKD